MEKYGLTMQGMMIKGKTKPKNLAFPIQIKLYNVPSLPYSLGNNVSFTLALAQVKIIVCKLNLDHNVLPRSPLEN